MSEILPPEALQLIVAHVSWGDVLAARATCKHWRHCLRDCIIRLTLHLAESPGPALQQALQQLPNVCSIELRLSGCTTPADLLGALQALRQARMLDVTIREIPAAVGPRSLRRYHHSLDLALLRHMRRLELHSAVTWSLEDIWRQVCRIPISAEGGGGGESDAPACQLQSLAIYSVAEASSPHTCPLKLPLPSSLLGGLTHLTTPLPGQFSPTSGEVCCTLAESHAQYLAALAAGLTGLQSLQLLGSCEVEATAFPSLTELQHAGEPQMPVFSSEGDGQLFLQRLPRLVRLVRPFQDSPLLLSALRSAPDLQHLTTALNTSQQAVPASVRSQLRSLQVVHMATFSQGQLQQVMSVGAGLTSLALTTAGLVPFTADPALGWPRGSRRVQDLQQGLLQMTNLVRLSLVVSPQQNAAFTLQQPAEVWAALPGLTHLQLRGMLLGAGAIGAHFDLTGFGWRAAHESRAASQLQLLHLRDLPQHGLRQLELSHYAIVLQPAEEPAAQPADMTDGLAWLSLGSQQSQQQALPRRHSGASSSGSSSSLQATAAASSAASRGLSKLQRLVLVHCACFAADRAAASDRAAVAAGDAAAVAGATAALQQLLQLLPQDGQLREMQLVAVPAAPAALALIGQQLASGLRQLHLSPISSNPAEVPGIQGAPQQAWAAAAAEFARQARRQGQLRNLWLAVPAGNSMQVVQACGLVSSLTQLQLQLHVSAAGSCGGDVRGWAASLRHLRVLDVAVWVRSTAACCSLMARSEPSAGEAPTGACCLDSLRELFLRRVPAELPACQVVYREEAAA